MLKLWLMCEIHWNIDGKKTIAIIFQQQLLIYLVFWLKLYDTTARNTAKIIVPVIQTGKIIPTCVDGASFAKTQTLHYPDSTWGSPTRRGTLLIFNSHTDIFLKITVLENFTDLKLPKYLVHLKITCKRVLFLVKLLVLLSEEWISKKITHLLRTSIFRTY